jgi:4-hydroxy-4-methyl-2-oxoglutarate aldolase
VWGGFACGERAILGELVGKHQLFYRHLWHCDVGGSAGRAAFNQGDLAGGGTPIGCSNREKETPFDAEIIAQRQPQYRNAIAICDDSVVVVIPPKRVDEAFIDKLDGSRYKRIFGTIVLIEKKGQI